MRRPHFAVPITAATDIEGARRSADQSRHSAMTEVSQGRPSVFPSRQPPSVLQGGDLGVAALMITAAELMTTVMMMETITTYELEWLAGGRSGSPLRLNLSHQSVASGSLPPSLPCSEV